MVRYIVGDLRTGRRIKWVSPETGTWAEALDGSGEVRCTVPLYDPTNQSLDLFNSAAVAKSYLAAVEGDSVLEAGPLWVHDWDEDTNQLTLAASNMLGYFDHRVLLPVLEGRTPTDPTTDTRFWPVVSDPEADGYPWPGDTRKSLQGIARYLVWQAQQHTGGDVPIILPDEIAGTNERWYRGADLAYVGQRLRELSDVDGGPDIMFTPRWTTDRQGIEWVMRIGTPDEPMLFSLQRQKFHIGLSKSSVSNVKARVVGTRMASRAFASGGRSQDVVIVKESNDSSLPDAGYALLEKVDTSHTTASEESTIQGYSDELTRAGRTAEVTISFDHDYSMTPPKLNAFNAGDFADVVVHKSNYLPNGRHSMRLLRRSGSLGSERVSLQFAPEVVDG